MPDLPHPKLPSDADVDRATRGPYDEKQAVHRLSRLVIPGLLVVAAVVAALVGSATLGVVFVFAAFIAGVADTLVRFGLASQGDRDDEAHARRAFRRRGRWPTDEQDTR